jgi:hypothetical protein
MAQQATPPGGGGTLNPDQLPVFYMKMRNDNVHARLGKLKAGQVVPMNQDMATRYLMAGAADQVSSGEYEDTQQKRRDKVSARQERFRNLNDQYAMWDVSTYRDVLTAPERGLRMAFERGIPLVNVHMLRDEDGDPLDPESDIEEILQARESLHAELQAPLAGHDRSSVMGGGSHYESNVQISPQPLNPGYRGMHERIAQNEVFAQRRALLQEQPDPGGRAIRLGLGRFWRAAEPALGPSGPALGYAARGTVVRAGGHPRPGDLARVRAAVVRPGRPAGPGAASRAAGLAGARVLRARR